MIKRLLSFLMPFLAFVTVKRVVGLLALVLVAGGAAVAWILSTSNVAIMNPQGIIATQQKDLIIFTTLLGMVIIIPVFVLLFAFAWRYRASNKKRQAKYTPDDASSTVLEVIWWGIPILIIGILSVVTWITTHSLDPYKQLESDKKPLTVQVVALEWKWLFLYPDQKIASLNELTIPVNTPINFEITADAPMSTFWIPNLGSQIYAMKGMTTKLHLRADREGTYVGTNTNINGEGYAKMTFQTKVVSDQTFNDWAANESLFEDNHLLWSAYLDLVKPSKDDGIRYYHFHDDNFFQSIVDQYMSHSGHSSNESGHTDHSAHDMMESMEGM